MILNHKNTPMIEQYLAIKDEYKDVLLFYRMGDFYELFFEDAIIASKALDITLTKRGKSNGTDIPMCGVPFHSADNYLPKLIKKGFHVAICEQTETPDEAKANGKKGPLKREVVRIISPGTITEDNLLESKTNNFLGAIIKLNNSISISWVDVSTGYFKSRNFENKNNEINQKQLLNNFLLRMNFSELLVSEAMNLDFIPEEWHVIIKRQPSSLFHYSVSLKQICSYYSIVSIDGIGIFNEGEIITAGVLLSYLNLTQCGKIPILSILKSETQNSYVEIDYFTQKSLEIVKNLSGDSEGSLISCIDETVTPFGARLLKQRILEPFYDINKINENYNLIEFFIENSHSSLNYKSYLNKIPDLERSLSRISSNRGGPKDLLLISNGFLYINDIYQDLTKPKKYKSKPSLLKNIIQSFSIDYNLFFEIQKAFKINVPLLAKEGGFIKDGFNEKLDHLRNLRNNEYNQIVELQKNYSQISKINSLKIKHNKVLGYHIEVRAMHDASLRNLEQFIHRQSTAQTSRFTTVELNEIEIQIASSSFKAIEIELEIFNFFIKKIVDIGNNILNITASVASLDIAVMAANQAKTRNYIRPELSNDKAFEIIDGRHPVVENQMTISENSFISNDCILNNKNYIWLITGPNMAGKSTYLRQNALIAIMAQAGFYVPAKKAKIGIFDKIFSRVGASDDLARGQSTFMIEMIETSAILNVSTENSLVILDEIGRGTATFDGLAIAWSVLDYLHNKIKPRTLFATHYHELTSLKEKLENLSCHKMVIKEWKDTIIFMHKIEKGEADKSYGIHVAKLAGLPNEVINKANKMLIKLESNQSEKKLNELEEFKDNFLSNNQNEFFLKELDALDADNISPREALDIIYKMKLLRQKNV